MQTDQDRTNAQADTTQAGTTQAGTGETDAGATPEPAASPDTPSPDTATPDAPSADAPSANLSGDPSSPDLSSSAGSPTRADPAPSDEAGGVAPSTSGTKATDLKADQPQIEGKIGHDEPLVQEGMQWFVLRVASNKEHSVQQTLLRKVQIENMTHLVGRILVPTEKIKTIKGGKTKIKEEKLYPGYVFVEMRLEDDGRIPQDIFFLIKETTGVGDFIGTAGRPTPMEMHEAEKMLLDSRAPEDEPTVRLSFEKGENVTIREGAFENYEGTVDEVFPEKGMVRVLVSIFGRQAPVDLEEWQIAKVDEA